MAKRKKDRTAELLAELVEGKSPEEILGKCGVLKQLTKRLVENALEGEMTEHLGYEPHAGHLKDLYGTEISPALISNVTDSVLKDVEA